MWWLEGRGAGLRNPDFENKTIPKLVEAVELIIQDAGSSPAASTLRQGFARQASLGKRVDLIFAGLTLPGLFTERLILTCPANAHASFE